MQKRTVVSIISVIVAVLSLVFVLRGCKKPNPPANSTPVAQVTPITNPTQIAHLNLPPLPNHATPVSVIPVPLPVQHPGIITTPNVVVGSDGNTYIANTSRVDWGFRLNPRVSAGLNSDLVPVAGLDVNFFTYWRFNADALLYIPLKETAVARIAAGPGLSYQLSTNMSVGSAYTWSIEKQAVVGFISFKF